MKYRFLSTLTPAQIYSRIRVTARPTGIGSIGLSDAFLYKIVDENRFMLTKTSTFGSYGYPFIGRLTFDGERTVIQGCFRPTTGLMVFMAAFFLAFLLLVAILNGLKFMVSFLIIYIPWACLLYLGFLFLPLLFFRKSEKAVLAYIEKSLLH